MRSKIENKQAKRHAIMLGYVETQEFMYNAGSLHLALCSFPYVIVLEYLYNPAAKQQIQNSDKENKTNAKKIA